MIAVTLELLDRIAAERRFQARTLAIAKRLFIHDQTPKRVAVEFSVNIQRVYAIRKEILLAAESLALPSGWSRAELVGPRALVEQFRVEFEAALTKVRPPAPAASRVRS